MHISSDDVALALAECGRVLKPNGLAAFGTWGGADTDKILADDHYDPPRFFSLRTDKTWRSLVAAHASVIELTTWKPASSVDHYQWIIARFNERSG